MFGKRQTKFAVGAGAAVLAVSAIAPGTKAVEAPPQTGFMMTSATFKDGEMLPARIAFTKTAQVPFCVGENISPQLAWSNPPPGVKSYALTMVDQEGGGGVGDFDLVAYGIPANVTSFAEGDLNKPSDKFVGGKNVWNTFTWRGMCPPAGTAPHHYVFKVVATDLDPKDLPPGLTYEELQGRIKGHAKGATALVGTFVRPKI